MTDGIGMPEMTQNLGQRYLRWLPVAFADLQKRTGTYEEAIRSAHRSGQIDLGKAPWCASAELLLTPRPPHPTGETRTA